MGKAHATLNMPAPALVATIGLMTSTSNVMSVGSFSVIAFPLLDTRILIPAENTSIKFRKSSFRT